jgi:D,D-heptose 1,7-bisphosphate phosphatase
MIRQVVFLVGGKGTRLGSLAANTPKPLLAIAPSVPFLDLLVENAARQGFSDIVLLAGHFADQVVARYQGRRIKDATIRVVQEREPAGTGGALGHARALLDPWFLLANGDSYFDINLRAFAAHRPADAVAHVALRMMQDVSRYGSVDLREGRIEKFMEKAIGQATPGLVNGGVYLTSRDILSYVSGNCSLEKDVFPALARRRALTGRVFEGYFLDIGLPETLAQANRELLRLFTRPAAFLDRDGVLNVDRGYTHRPEQLAWTKNAREAVLALNNAGYLVIVVTNQAGIAHGYYSEEDMRAFHQRMQSELAEIGAHIDAFYHCPFHPDAVTDRYRHPAHADRKPNPGMILKAKRDWAIRDAGSFLIGDSSSDIEAALRAGVPGVRFAGGDLLALVKETWKAAQAKAASRAFVTDKAKPVAMEAD